MLIRYYAHKRYYVVITIFAKLPILTLFLLQFLFFSIKMSDKRSKKNTTKDIKYNKKASNNRKIPTLRLYNDAEIPAIYRPHI